MKAIPAIPKWLLLMCGLMFGTYQFFHPVQPIAAYLTLPHRVYLADNYWAFSDAIFRSQNVAWAESVLMPLLAKVLGASSDRLAFQFLNVILTIFITPVFCLALTKRVQNTWAVFIGLAIFVCTFKYLNDYVLGAPDPLTMIFILLAAVSQGRLLAIYVCLAGLTHFSLTAFAIVAMAPLQILAESDSDGKRRQLKYMLLGLIASKILLLGWYWTFDYQLFSRWDFIKEKGFGHFWALFFENPKYFFYTPGRWFGVLGVLGLLYITVMRRYSVALGYCFALCVAYSAMFITLDGLRIFSVVIIGAYFNFLCLVLNCSFKDKHESGCLPR